VRSLLAEKQGLTLVEVLAALTVLSIGVVALIAVLPLASFGVHEGGHRSGATFLALERLEDVRRVLDSARAEGDPAAADRIEFPDEPALPPPHTAFSRSVQVRDCGLETGCAGLQAPGLRQITVTVTYPGTAGSGAGPAHRGAVSLSTYLLSPQISPR
jgi:prepilin-type N-terminal cleavage/methylation domain-containing protein